ncbi:MAG: PD-(D/E)XK nuclease family protein [Oscillospiraceae bacterium]|nr:PD-(D/E)XK nuclease family protein [Oscillospiraceae bacterium]
MDTTMTEAQIKEAIAKMNNSEEYLALRKYYAEESLFKILHVSREERVHSNFIAWLLTPTSHHELTYFPLQKFLQMLAVVGQKDPQSYFPKEHADDFLLEDYTLTEDCEVRTEVPTGKIAGVDEEGRIDILIHLRFKESDKTLPIILENKVGSKENKRKNKMQTQTYHDWGTVVYGDRTRYEAPIYIFLAPDYERDIKCSSPEFIKLSYQNMVDYLIEPCLRRTQNGQAEYLIENYLRCLSNSTFNKVDGKEGRIMAFTERELELLEKFHAKNKDLIDAVLTMLANDEETSVEDRKHLQAALKLSNGRDNSKYLLDGQKCAKGQLVQEMVKKYLRDHPTADIAELKQVFNLKLDANKKPIVLFDTEATQVMKDCKKAVPLTLADGTVIYINNQVTIGDMQEILRIADELKYPVTKV